MTVIEYFDKDDCENIGSTLMYAPEKTILLGKNINRMDKRIKRYRTVLQSRGIQTTFTSMEVKNENSISAITALLEGIINSNDDCVFDLTGGSELYLTAVGILAERYNQPQDGTGRKNRVQMQRVNLRSGKITDADGDNFPCKIKNPLALTVEEYIALYGGKVVYESASKPDATHRWTMDDRLTDDVMNLWRICRADPRLWNTQIGLMKALWNQFGEADTLGFSVGTTQFEQTLRDGRMSVNFFRSLLRRLQACGLLTYTTDKEQTTLRFRDEAALRLLTTEGQVLEMLVYCRATALEKRGKKIYSDALTGVTIDWDGVTHEYCGMDTENEIDVLLMHGMIPVFISCKNGGFDVNELYKLNTVAERFGGIYAKKILVASAFNSLSGHEMIARRAEEMNILIVDDIADFDVCDNKQLKALDEEIANFRNATVQKKSS